MTRCLQCWHDFESLQYICKIRSQTFFNKQLHFNILNPRISGHSENGSLYNVAKFNWFILMVRKSVSLTFLDVDLLSTRGYGCGHVTGLTHGEKGCGRRLHRQTNHPLIHKTRQVCWDKDWHTLHKYSLLLKSNNINSFYISISLITL